MTHDDGSTVRLPGDRDGLPDRGFGYDQGAAPDAFAESGYDTGYGYDQSAGYGADETARYDPGYASPYQPTPPDQTIAIGADEPAGDGRDRLLVHLVWEILLIVLVAGLAGYAYMTEPKIFSTGGRTELFVSAAVLGLMALGLSLSLRSAAPNLAVGGVAAAAGVVFAKLHGHGTLASLGLAVGVAMLVGLAMGIVVAVLHVPAWAASLGGLVGSVALARGLGGGRLVELPGHPYDPARQATLWFGGFVVVSVLAGILLLTPPLRRAVGAFRPAADPAARRGPGAAFLAMLALVVSSGLAGAAGVLSTLHAGAAAGGTDDGLLSTVLVLGAVLVGGVSAFGRRGGLLGTALGVFAVAVMAQFALLKGWNTAVAQLVVAAAAVALGLVVTRLVEWGGRPRGADWTG